MNNEWQPFSLQIGALGHDSEVVYMTIKIRVLKGLFQFYTE